MRRPEKRFDLVVAAVELLRATRPEVQLVVADSEPHERMPLFMNACDVLILASEGEGSPMVIKEAMACNLPIVSVDVGDVAEVIGRTAGRTSPIEGCFLVERPSSSKEQDLRSHRLKGLDGARPKRWSSRLKAVSRPTFGHPKLSAWSRYGPSWPTLRQAQGDALRQAQGDALRQAQGDARPTHCVSPEENLPQALAARLAEALDFGGRTAGRERIMALSLDAIAGRLEEIYRDVIAKESRRSPSGGRIE
jgi:glycosyltransferase involved in cell wall biosynthesis